MKKLGVGIIGLGYAGRKHFDAYKNHPGTEVKALCDNSKDRLNSFNVKGTSLISNYEEMLERKDVDIVSICSPNYMHAEQALKALEKGKHVICEKPLATSFKDCEKIVKMADRRNECKFMVGQILRFSPLFKVVKRLYMEGELGEAFFAESNYLHNIEGRIKTWWEDSRNPSHFALLGGGIHSVDLLGWIIGEIEEVYVLSSNKVLKNFPHDDSVLMSLRFKNGCIGKIAVFLACKRPYSIDISVYGTKGTLINNKIYYSKIREMEDFMTIPITILPEHPYFYEEIDHFIDCVVNNRPPLINVREGAKAVSVCLAGGESMETGKPARVKYDF